VAASSERAVQHALAGGRREQGSCFVSKDGDVVERRHGNLHKPETIDCRDKRARAA
jgi:hypothetical protein